MIINALSWATGVKRQLTAYMAFAGQDTMQYEALWIRHTHEDRIKLHFCTPRLELTPGRSLNIAPLGYQNVFDSLRDVMSQRYGWADPMELERTQEVRDTIETPKRAQGRDELHACTHGAASFRSHGSVTFSCRAPGAQQCLRDCQKVLYTLQAPARTIA